MRHSFYPGRRRQEIKALLVSANETIEIIDTKKDNLILHFAKQPRKRKCRFHYKAVTDLRASSSSSF
jgi:alanyl-tRNA synthetase